MLTTIHGPSTDLAKRDFDIDSDTLFTRFVFRSGLLRTSGHEVEWRHNLLQEFFAGRGVPNASFLYRRGQRRVVAGADPRFAGTIQVVLPDLGVQTLRHAKRTADGRLGAIAFCRLSAALSVIRFAMLAAAALVGDYAL